LLLLLLLPSLPLSPLPSIPPPLTPKIHPKSLPKHTHSIKNRPNPPLFPTQKRRTRTK
jgi:hypothetical protein